jgi:hypothetical protein
VPKEPEFSRVYSAFLLVRRERVIRLGLGGIDCGIANPVDLSPDIAATLDHIGESLRAASNYG